MQDALLNSCKRRWLRSGDSSNIYKYVLRGGEPSAIRARQIGGGATGRGLRMSMPGAARAASTPRRYTATVFTRTELPRMLYNS